MPAERKKSEGSWTIKNMPASIRIAVAAVADHGDTGKWVGTAIDAYLEAGKREFAGSSGPPLSESNPALWDRLQEARANMGEPRP